MKLYDFPFAPNPIKTRVYLAEKGIDIPLVRVNIVNGEQHAPEALARNPAGAVPVLELDDGTCLSESSAIIEYIEELHPEPPMIGRKPRERARVRELERRADLGVLSRVATIVHNQQAILPGGNPVAIIAEKARAPLAKALRILDDAIGSHPYLAGEQPTIADCTLFAAFRFAEFGKVELDPDCRRLHAWYARFSARPSASA